MTLDERHESVERDYAARPVLSLGARSYSARHGGSWPPWLMVQVAPTSGATVVNVGGEFACWARSKELPRSETRLRDFFLPKDAWQRLEAFDRERVERPILFFVRFGIGHVAGALSP